MSNVNILGAAKTKGSSETRVVLLKEKELKGLMIFACLFKLPVTGS